MTKRTVLVVFMTLAAGCGSQPPHPADLDQDIAAELKSAAEHRSREAENAKINEALLPPLRAEIPPLSVKPLEPKFDLSVSNAPAAQVFMSIVSGTRYSMLVHPNVTGTISVNLKDVTVREALDAIRELYGYEYKVDGTRIFIQPVSMQTRVFRVNYLIGQRQGRSDVRVTSGSVSDAPAGAPGVPGAPVTATPGTTANVVNDSSRIQTQTKSDFWDDLTQTLRAIVGVEGGRNVVVNPQAGVVVVRAMPPELRNVEAYLRAIQLSVDRQVVLEAKIIEVTLSSGFQAGINWAAFQRNGISTGGVLSPNTTLSTQGIIGSNLNAAPGTSGINSGLSADIANRTVASGSTLIPGFAGGTMFGVALQAENFAALLQFLESQGTVQVLSSPRIATLNNQKAVLKVGTDEFFLTNISGSTTTTTATTGTATPSFPTITLRPFFSGVALDITPQIDEESNIILHIHPSVSDVATDNKQINLGQVFGGQVTLPLAKSTVSETDSVVKASDGNIVAIGGLMKVDVEDNRSGLPGVQDIPGVGGLFRSTARTMVKKELVILIKPTVAQTGFETAEDIRQSRERIINLIPPAAGSGEMR